MKLTIGDKRIGNDEPCFIIAEIGINHNGDMDKARELVEDACHCHVDAVKFQTHIPEKEMLRNVPTANYVGEPLFDLLKRVELSEEQHKELKKYAEDRGLIFLSTPFCKEAVDLLNDIGVSAFKVGSGEMTNYPLLQYIAQKNKPMIVSTGMSTMNEIEETVWFLTKHRARFSLLHCVSTYPSKLEHLNLKMISQLKCKYQKYMIPIGFSDHSTSIYPAFASVALGACIIEKHFTIDKNWEGPDQRASATPVEMEQLVEGVRTIEQAMKGHRKMIFQEEKPIRLMARESIVSTTDIPKGTPIQEHMITTKRPNTGIPARFYWDVIGKKTRKNVKADASIKWRDLERTY